MGIQLHQAPSGPELLGTADGQVPVWDDEEQEWEVSSGVFFIPTDPVFVEQYLEAAGNDIRTAIVAALAANPNSHRFLLPSGSWEFLGSSISQNQGLRNDITIEGQNTRLYRDMAGQPSAQIIFFIRSDTGVGTHADRITFKGIRFSLLNVITSDFGYAIGLESASNCRIQDCFFECTLIAGALTGRQRWGAAFFGGDQVLDPTAGTNNLMQNIGLRLAQLQGCGSGRSVDGIIIDNILCNEANDLAVSIVTTTGFNCQNAGITNVYAHNVAGSGVVFIGSDGAGTGIGAAICRNLYVDGIFLDGERAIDLTFPFICSVVINGGLITENVICTNVGSQLTNTVTTGQTKSVMILSQDDETSWHGLSVSDCQLGIVSTIDPIEALFIDGTNMTGVNITNVTVRGVRGIRITNVDQMVMSNTITENGSCLIQALSKNLTLGLQFSNCNFTRTTGFQACIQFSSTTASSMSKVMLSNVICNGNGVPIGVGLGGGTMQMFLNNIENTNGSNPTAETLAGIVRYSNLRGLLVTTTVSVVVPAVAAGNVDYVDVAMTGTRLADLAVTENVIVNPTADLVAAGAGGGYLNARVSAVGTVRCAYIGPLAGGASDHTFARI